jgi:hypothetical protein
VWVICRILAYGTAFPGFIAMLANLMHSNRSLVEREDGFVSDHWRADYAQGSDFSIYCLKVRRG